MSLWSRDRVEVFLAPTRVELVRRSGGLRLRSGAMRSPGGMRVAHDCVEAADNPWRAALQTLERALGELAWRNADAHVTLSNHYVRYALVPAARELRGGDERVAAARHQLRAVFGERAENWRVAYADDARGNGLAAGIEAELMDGIASALRAAQLRPAALEPYLCTAFNLCRRAVRGAPVWLVVAEAGRLCVSYLDGGAWRKIRNERARGSLEEALPMLLERSRLADGIGGAGGRVLLVTREPVQPAFPRDSGWTVEHVRMPDTFAAPRATEH